MFGLIVGKPLGIMLFSYLGVRLNMIEKPEGATWWSIFSVSILAGIGFTMSIFTSELAFAGNMDIITVAKVSICGASVFSMFLACFVSTIT